MCLSIPAKIIEIENDMAKVSISGNIYSANISMVENVSPGDYILLHAGFAIQKIDDKEASETNRLLEEIKIKSQEGFDKNKHRF